MLIFLYFPPFFVFIVDSEEGEEERDQRAKEGVRDSERKPTSPPSRSPLLPSRRVPFLALRGLCIIIQVFFYHG